MANRKLAQYVYNRSAILKIRPGVRGPRYTGQVSWGVLLAVLGLLSVAKEAQAAYLDPGSGSFILQVVIAGLMGLLLAVKIYWSKVIAFFKGASSERPADETKIGNKLAGEENKPTN